MPDPINIPDYSQSAGVPSQWNQDIGATDVALITGNVPPVLTVDHLFAASQNIPALTPVGFNDADELVAAVTASADPADDIVAVGITVTAVVTDASATRKGGPVYRGGCFNPDKLNWPASFNTDARKFSAFEGAPSPTAIVIRRPKTATV